MNNHNNNNNNSESVLVFALAILFFFFIAIPAIYVAKKELINHSILALSAFNLSFFTHFSLDALEDYQTIKNMNPASMNFSETYMVLQYTGKWIRYPLIFLLFIMGLVSIFLSSKKWLHRKFTMASLLQHNATNFPCTTPILGKAEYLLSLESFDKGVWKVARTPAQFCVENQLLEYPDDRLIQWDDAFRNGVAHVDMQAYGQASLNQDKCIQVLEQQIGAKKREFNELPPLRKALVSAFLAFGNENKKDAIEILNTCSASYFEDGEKCYCKCFDDIEFMKFVHNTYAKYENIYSKFIAMHNNYEMTWLMALLFFARKKGLLAPSQFLFARPMDRELWYALHQCGGRVAWTEALSAWTHYFAEESAQKALNEFNAKPAYDFIHTSLYNQGWLFYGE